MLRKIIFLFFVFVASGLLQAETTTGYKFFLVKESALWLAGDSTMHKYESPASVILLSAEGEIESGLLKQKNTVTG